MFKVFFHRRVLKEVKILSKEDRERVLRAIREMRDNPFLGDVKPLKGLKGVFRKRVGKYRVAFIVNFEKNEVVVVKLAKKEEFYREI